METFLAILLAVLKMIGQEQTDWAKKQQLALDVSAAERLQEKSAALKASIEAGKTELSAQKFEIDGILDAKKEDINAKRKELSTLDNATLVDRINQLLK